MLAGEHTFTLKSAKRNNFALRPRQVGNLMQELEDAMEPDHSLAKPLQQWVFSQILEHPDVCCMRDLIVKVR